MTYCGHCGARFSGDAWPRTCGSCGRVTYRNPLPVAVALVPVAGGRLLVVRRNIEPQRGRLCLPGGYMDHGETWQEAVVRELREETGVRFAPADVRLFDVHSNRACVAVFGVLPEIEEPPVHRDEEVSEVLTAGPDTPLAFPGHIAAAARYFGR